MALPDGVEKLFSVAPDTKIIISLRDPVARALSSYRYFEHFESALSTHLEDEISLMAEYGVAPDNRGMVSSAQAVDVLLTALGATDRI